MEKLTVRFDEETFEKIKKDSIRNNTSFAEIVRNILIEYYSPSNDIQEEKLLKKFDELEKNILSILDNRIENIDQKISRDTSYTLIVYHLIKELIGDLFAGDKSEDERTEKIRHAISFAKILALKAHPVDSMVSKETITSNIKKEYLQ